MSDDSVRIPINNKVLFENSALVQFFRGMAYVISLREALHVLCDAAIRNTDLMDESQKKAREAIMAVSEKIMTQRIEYELDLALAHLERYFEQLP